MRESPGRRRGVGAATRRRHAPLLLTASLLGATVSAARATAQPVLGAGDDATLPGRGRLRVRGVPTLVSADERAGGLTGVSGGRVPLASEFGADTLGPAQLPGLAPVLDTLRAVTGNANLGLVLGAARVRARTTGIVVPVHAEYGLTRRLAVAVTVPFVRTRSSVNVVVNDGGGFGNFGVNPSRISSTQADAASRNGAVQTNLTNAVAAVRAQCPNAAAPDCAEGLALAAAAERFRVAIAGVYGSGTAAGRFVVPLAGSDAQAAVAQRLTALSTQFAQRGVQLDGAAAPAASRARLASPTFAALLLDTATGIALDQLTLAPLASYNRSSIGDVDVTASFLWLDTFGGDGRDGGVRARVTPVPGLRMRSTITGGWRFGAGNTRQPALLYDVPPSERMSAALVRSATDVAAGRFSASVVARLALPVADEVVLRIPEAFDRPYAPAYRVRDVRRKLGRDVELEVTPRYAAGEAFALFAQGLYRHRAEAEYTGSFTATAAETGAGEVTFDAAPLGIGTGVRETRAGFGVAYSTMAAWSRGKSALPVELSYLHAVTTSASGGAVPRVSTDQLSVRVYARLFGR